MSDEIHEILKKCFVFDPRARPSVFEILKSQFFVKNGFIIN
jgi:serine/threonine protein kinase